jgi:hypothetical protein
VYRPHPSLAAASDLKLFLTTATLACLLERHLCSPHFIFSLLVCTAVSDHVVALRHTAVALCWTVPLILHAGGCFRTTSVSSHLLLQPTKSPTSSRTLTCSTGLSPTKTCTVSTQSLLLQKTPLAARAKHDVALGVHAGEGGTCGDDGNRGALCAA